MIEPHMNALVWTRPRELVMQTLDTPQPAAEEVLIEVGAVGVCGSELSGYLGQSSIRVPPLVMGHEAAGHVVAVNGGTFADGSTPKLGTAVTFNPLVTCGVCNWCRAGRENLCRKRTLIGAARAGAFARYVAVPARQCYPLPVGMSLAAGSLVEPLACGVRAARQALLQPGQRVLILGAGPIGLCCLIGARDMGVEQIAISDVADQRLHVAHLWGATETINARNVDVLQAVEAFQPGGVDAVIDAVGTDQTREQAVRAVAPGGQVVFLGLHEEASPLAANYLVRQEITITGSFSYVSADFAHALELLAGGVASPSAEWLAERPLHDGPAIFEELVAGKATTTKYVLLPE